MTATAERSFGTVIREIGGNVDRIVRAEMRMAIAEWHVGLDAAMSASALLGTGVACALLAAAFFLLSVMLILARVMPAWLAALAVAAVIGAAAAYLLRAGRERFAHGLLPKSDPIAPVPEPHA